jgi:hypothetical protein
VIIADPADPTNFENNDSEKQRCSGHNQRRLSRADDSSSDIDFQGDTSCPVK